MTHLRRSPLRTIVAGVRRIVEEQLLSRKLRFVICALILIAAVAAGIGSRTSLAQAPQTPVTKDSSVTTSYDPPTTVSYEPIYAALREGRVLERVAEYIHSLRLPSSLHLKVTDCRGEVDAWYHSESRSITICYEYIDHLDRIRRNLPPEAVAVGLTPEQAIVGPFLEVVAHEVAHALFDILKVPVLGREEDAADQVAAYTLLHLGQDQARMAIAGTAAMYATEAQREDPKEKNLAGVHSLPSQRFYNLLCLAYGFDSKTFAPVVDMGLLPKERAPSCEGEYRQVDYAVRTLILARLGQ